MAKSIRTKIKCENLAPFTLLEKELNTSLLRIGVFANNGSGKTFMSRMFRLLEHSEIQTTSEGSPTDYLIRFGCKKATFAFSICDGANVIEDVNIEINSSIPPKIPSTYYIYHTFTHDYVEENIRALNYEKDSNITGYILGKTNIDLTDEENRLKQISDSGKSLKQEIERIIQEFIKDKLANINLSRIQEFKTYLSVNYILDSDKYGVIPNVKSFDATIEDYNKVKAIPENLQHVPTIQMPELDLKTIEDAISILATEYTVSQIAENFKESIKGKESFLESGLTFYHPDKECPFCGQPYNSMALSLINSYVDYFKATETKVIKSIRLRIEQLNSLLSILTELKKKSDYQQAVLDKYKNSYIPSYSDQHCIHLEIISVVHLFNQIIQCLESKLESLKVSLKVEDGFLENLRNEWNKIEIVIHNYNKLVTGLNTRISKISDEHLNTRSNICCSSYNHLATLLKDKIQKRKQLLDEYKELDLTIKKKKEQEKTNKKEKVAETIRNVLDYFFAGKYTLNSDTFQLILNSHEMEKGQTSKVLSEGEKSIIAFAYYLGDTHVKVTRDEDYARLFFIIDDPISSMDFSYVYTLSGVIREIHKILPKIGNRYRYIIFTHNNDFMRIIHENKIISTALLLSNNSLEELNVNFAVPYISHLIDIYKVARKNIKATHTTPNSIRHIIETLTKFHNISMSEESIAEYIRLNIPNDKKTYTLINDLSHGGWRSEQAPITDADYKDICEEIIAHIEKKFPKQIEYCQSNTK